MNAYLCLQQLEDDLEHARNNPHDEAFFGTMVERYKNATSEVQAVLKSALYDRMLEYNPAYMMERIAVEHPNTVIFRNTESDPFFHV